MHVLASKLYRYENICNAGLNMEKMLKRKCCLCLLIDEEMIKNGTQWGCV